MSEQRQWPVDKNDIEEDPRKLWIEHGSDFLYHAQGKTEGDGAKVRNTILFPRMERLLGDITSETTILDAGCGNSIFCDRLRDKTSAIFEFDIVPALLASEENSEKKVFRADMTQTLPVPKESFNLVVSNLTLMWLPEIETFAKEASRVLKPQGKLVFSVTHPFVNLGEWDNSDPEHQALVNKHPLSGGVFKKMINMTNGPYLYYQRPPSEYVNTFTKAGLTLVPENGYEEVFFTDEELKILGPDYKRHQDYPLFLLLSFVK